MGYHVSIECDSGSLAMRMNGVLWREEGMERTYRNRVLFSLREGLASIDGRHSVIRVVVLCDGALLGDVGDRGGGRGSF